MGPWFGSFSANEWAGALGSHNNNVSGRFEDLSVWFYAWTGLVQNFEFYTDVQYKRTKIELMIDFEFSYEKTGFSFTKKVCISQVQIRNPGEFINVGYIF